MDDAASHMQMLKDLIHYTYPNLLDTMFNYGSYERLEVDLDYPQLKERMPDRIMDDISWDLIEVESLFSVMDHTKTKIGRKVLYRSLANPPTSLELIRAKQDSLREVEDNNELRERLNSYLRALTYDEGSMIGFMFHEFDGRHTQHGTYRSMKFYFENMAGRIDDIPEPETPYLRTLIDDIREFGDTRTMDMIGGPVYSTFGGLKHGGEIDWHTPKVKFTMRKNKPIPITLSALTMIAGMSAVLYDTPPMSPIRIVSFTPVFVAMVPALLLARSPAYWDQRIFMDPLKSMYRSDRRLGTAVDAIGKIDELISFYEYGKDLDEYRAIPTVTDTYNHHLKAKDAVNPLLWTDRNPDGKWCVPNDIMLDGQHVTVLTGSNSGGKTTIAKTAMHMQMMGQIGCYVPAASAEMSIADMIGYQMPMVDSVMNRHGRFGTELQRTKDLFFAATPKSLVVLDDALAGATRHEESTEKSFEILEGFNTTGNNVILITHNTDLAELLRENEIGEYMQVEFLDGAPTYKIVPGIAESSYSEEVARDIGFTKEHIIAHLKKKGYM